MDDSVLPRKNPVGDLWIVYDAAEYERAMDAAEGAFIATPLGVGSGKSADQVEAAMVQQRVHGGDFSAKRFKAIPFYEAPPTDAIRVGIDALLHLMTAALGASARVYGRKGT